MKLSNKDKQLIRQAMFNQVENLIFAISDKHSGYYDEFKHLIDANPENWSVDVADYCYKIVGLRPK